MPRSTVPLVSRRLLLAGLVLAAACAPDAGLTGPSDQPRGAASIGLTEALPGTCNYDVGADLGGTWTARFQEEFTDPGLSLWQIWTGGAFNDELQYYQSSNLAVAGSGLTITVTPDHIVGGATNPYDPTPKDFSYTSGRIESKATFSASRTTPKVRMAARLKLPGGSGMWPAFWSYGDPWPTQGEIDILEARGQEPFQYQTAYWYGRRRGVNLVQNSATTVYSGPSLSECFHVYEVIWEKDRLTFLYDGQTVDVKTGGYIPNMYGKQQRVTLNLAVGGLFFGDPAVLIEPDILQADWVRVYTSR